LPADRVTLFEGKLMHGNYKIDVTWIRTRGLTLRGIANGYAKIALERNLTKR
jgi:hypothetical protein